MHIFIFDYDRTMIGNVHHFVNEFNIIFEFNDYVKLKNNKYNYKIKQTTVSDDIIQSKLTRPYLKEFIDFLYEKFEEVYIFIYTNSTKNFINLSAKIVEKKLGIKINKPYFSRDENINDKYIGNIYSKIEESIGKKITNNDKIFFIDDRPNNLFDHPELQILCNPYNYYYYYDIKQKLKDYYKIPNELLDNKDIVEIIYKYDVPYYSSNGNIYQSDLALYNISSALNIRKMELSETDDIFFKKLKDIMSKTLDIKKINNMLLE